MESGREAENFGSNKKSKADDGEETRQWQERPRAFKAQIVVGNPLRLEPRWNLTWIKKVLSLQLLSPQPWMESQCPFGVQTRGDRSEAIPQERNTMRIVRKFSNNRERDVEQFVAFPVLQKSWS